MSDRGEEKDKKIAELSGISQMMQRQIDSQTNEILQKEAQISDQGAEN